MKHLHVVFPIILCLAAIIDGDAQQRLDFPLSISGDELSMPWNGGFNAPQFSNIDLNRDGVTDMISFDRQGDQLRTYLRLPDSGRWILDWSYQFIFPPLVDWVLIADYNKDGVEDLFTSSSETGVAGISVYRGGYSNDQWSFTRLSDRDKLYLQVTAGGGLTNLYVSWDDIPAIIDIDGDGDLDILSFEPGGSFISYFANQSVENGWGKDSLRFKLQDICWGKILENELSETVYLSDNPAMCSDGHVLEEDPIVPRHAGSTILALDVDEDGDKDAFIGDIASKGIVYLYNGLTAQQAWITAQDNHFPSQDTAVMLPYFVGSYSVQLDDDPEPEFIAAVNSRSLSEDKLSVWRYDDDPIPGPLNYTLTEKGYFQNDMIDVGSYSRPAVADVTGDGLPDLVIGGYTFAESVLTRRPALWLFENQGTATQPYFDRIDDDFLMMSQFGSIPTFDFSPAFGDIDGNKTIDLIVGDQNGKLFFYKNSALPGSAMQFESAVYPYMNIAVGVSATPQIADINGDGLGDLVIGERTGNADNNGRCSNLNYFENQGAEGFAAFNSDVNLAPNTQCFGRLLFDLQPGLPQYSTPSIVPTQDELVLMTGSDPGDLYVYGDLAQGKTGPITLLDDHYHQIDVGNRSAPVVADLNADGMYDLIVGNQRGGLELFATDLTVGTTAVKYPARPDEKPYVCFNSMGSGEVEIVWKNGVGGILHLTDVNGRIIYADQSESGLNQKIELGPFPSGIYFLQLHRKGFSWVEKIIKP